MPFSTLRSSARGARTWPPSAAVRQRSIAAMTFSLAQAHMAGIGFAPCCAVAAERYPRPPASGALQLEQVRRQHDITVLATLALLDPEQHARTGEVGHLERRHFGNLLSRPIGDAQCRLVL